MNSEKEATEALREFEARYDLLRLQVEGLSYWMALRFAIHHRLSGAQLEKPPRDRTFFLRTALGEATRYWFPPKKQIVIRTSSSFHEFQGNSYKDLFFDDLIFGIESVFKLEAINSQAHFLEQRGKKRTPHDITNAYINFHAKLMARTFKPSGVRSVANEIHIALEKGFPHLQISRDWVQYELNAFHWRRKVVAGLLKRINARLVLTSSTDDYAVFAAAKDCTIKCYEFQHGVFTKYHPDVMWEYMSDFRDHLIAPDKIFLFGRFWKDELLETGFYREDELIPAGKSLIENYRKTKSTLRPKEKGKALKLVLATQGKIQREALIDFVEEFLYLSRQSDLDFNMVICLHPRNDFAPTPYESRFNDWSSVRVKQGTQPPSIYELLIDADYHLAIFSATHFDALGLDIPTIVLGLPGHEIVLPIIQSGDALFARTPKDLLRLLSNSVKPKNTDTSSKYYTPDPIKSVQSYLEIG